MIQSLKQYLGEPMIVLEANGGWCWVYGPGTPPKTLTYLLTDNDFIWAKAYYKHIMRKA